MRPENSMKIPFNRPYMTGKELWYVSQAHANGHLAGDGEFTRRCNAWLENRVGCNKALLTHSCTAALEMTAILAELEPGDEVKADTPLFVIEAMKMESTITAPVNGKVKAIHLNAGTLVKQGDLVVEFGI